MMRLAEAPDSVPPCGMMAERLASLALQWKLTILRLA